MDAVESGIKPCDLAKEALHEHPLTPLTTFKLKDTLDIRQFYINSLGVTDNEMQTMPWASILEKVVRIQESQQLCVVKDLSAHDIVMRLMRKENYLIGMLNKGVLAFPISSWIPGAGPTVKKDANGTRYCLTLTKTLEWTLNWCILHSMFDRLVDHLFKHRINSSVTHASDYLKQFPSPVLSIIAKFVSFVFGGFAAILIIIAFLEESLLEGHIFGRNLFWYTAVFGAITAISRALVSDELLVLDPHGTMSLTVQHTHYMPKKWRRKENTEFVRVEFETLFQYTGKMLLEEMASIFLTPFLLIFVVPERVDDILQFIADFTVDVEGVGHVCSFSVFDFKKHGNSKYASPHNSSSTYRSSQGKMEKSFLSFQSSYPSWEPSADGKQFLSTLKAFKEQKFQEQGITPGYMTINRPPHGDPNSYFSVENTGLNVSKTTCQRDCMWLVDPVHKNHPYILDWYYTSSHHHQRGPQDIESGPVDVDDTMANMWDPPNLSRVRVQYDDHWGSLFDDRIRSNIEASTSAPLSRGSVLQHHDFGDMGQTGRSQWWARPQGVGPGPQTSFVEPPNFSREDYNDYHDNFSDRSFEEHGRPFDWGPSKSNELSKTFYMDDIGGKFDLPFDDIYEEHSESPPRTPRL
ncbi:hypothetical protein M8C21_003160 [Ambrosia artemisiifolia]|uniref:Autophagy-related protein 9 n=1 Tax=Ambrosia artemisiifolia TaxID=4212 RepID=A0AAD5C587_AMBAR|nr:hypothetical protein M8C21_003160 [Ambrosia artemisiifolia]